MLTAMEETIEDADAEHQPDAEQDALSKSLWKL